jgi:gliding motility-associated-like protein
MMKKIIVVLLLSFMPLLPSSGQMVVTDPAHTAASILGHFKDLEEAIRSGVQLLNQLTVLKQTYSPYITPNDDGFNDYFEVVGIEKCPNSKLIILTPVGTIIYTAEPYNNDFDSKNPDISAGAYYYIFFCDKNGSPVKKGYFEIIK